MKENSALPQSMASISVCAKGNCASCHPSQIREGAFPVFTDFGFQALGGHVAVDPVPPDTWPRAGQRLTQLWGTKSSKAQISNAIPEKSSEGLHKCRHVYAACYWP